jgi:Uma2 family endonuclease
MVTRTQTLTLMEFLQIPETQPASEFINGEISQKPMPQGEYSVLQECLCAQINGVAKATKIAYAFPELRCSFGVSVVVPDVSVFCWQRIPRTETGRVANRFEVPPDWVIEILSPEQSQTKVLEKLLLCIDHGSTLGWLIDPAESSVLVVFAEQRMRVLRSEATLPVLEGINLELTVDDVFRWLALS